MEALRDRRVVRVEPQREIRREHHRRMALRRIVRIRHGPAAPSSPSASMVCKAGYSVNSTRI